MMKKWFALMLVAAMLLAASGLALAATEKGGGPPFGDPRGWTVVEGASELAGEEPELGRTHPFKENKKIGPPEFVMEMLGKNVQIMERDKFLVHGRPFESELPPVIKEGRTLVPVRALSNALGAEVKWDDGKITITKAVYDSSEDAVTVAFHVYANGNEDNIMIFKVNDETYELDVSAQIFQNRTFVPMRFVAIAFGKEVGYDQLTRSVYLGKVEN